MLIKNYKENGHLYSNLIVLCLSLRYLERAIRARTFCVVRTSERDAPALWKKKDYEKMWKKCSFVAFFCGRKHKIECTTLLEDEEKSLFFLFFFLELGRVWNDDV